MEPQTPQPDWTPKQWLLYALDCYQIKVWQNEGQYITVSDGYQIEVESNGIFKLRSGKMVIAPFGDLDELCGFLEAAGVQKIEK
jgi:hypothetical protein